MLEERGGGEGAANEEVSVSCCVGWCPVDVSPLSVALFALVLVSTGDIDIAYRLGKLALRLTEKANGQRCLAEVAFFVGGCVSWVS